MGSYAYVGTYTKGAGGGIHVFHVEPATGAWTPSTVVTASNPAFLALHPSRRWLYAANEGPAQGAVSAFVIDQRTGELSLLNQEPVPDGPPCHISVDATGRWVFVANYSSGSLCVYRTERDGRLGAMSDHVQHRGRGRNPKRQEGPHAHSISLDAGSRFALVCDLGLDKLLIYRVDLEKGKLIAHGEVRTRSGAGPRHFAFEPNGRYGYVINELDNTVTAFAYDSDAGAMAEIQTIPTLPEGCSEESYAGAIHAHPAGKFIYGSNRGHDSIAIFRLDSASGRLSARGHQPTRGMWPRSFGIDGSGRFLFSANQKSDTIVPFHVDADTGLLRPSGSSVCVPTPACVLMAEL